MPLPYSFPKVVSHNGTPARALPSTHTPSWGAKGRPERKPQRSTHRVLPGLCAAPALRRAVCSKLFRGLHEIVLGLAKPGPDLIWKPLAQVPAIAHGPESIAGVAPFADKVDERKFLLLALQSHETSSPGRAKYPARLVHKAEH